MPRALSLLAAFASPVFMCAAIAGWLFEVWPANPLTLGVSALLVMGGPILGIVHVATADTWRDDEAEASAPAAARPAPAVARTARATHAAPAAATAPVRVPEPIILTAKAADARRFASWRDTPNPAITRRERERRASRYLRS
jgi:hypothetical protein